MDFNDFLKQLDSSYLREDLTERYRAMFRDGMSAEEAAAVAMEYAREISLLTVEQYHRWGISR